MIILNSKLNSMMNIIDKKQNKMFDKQQLMQTGNFEWS